MTPRPGAEGTVLGGRYTLTERIAVGGMGEVWAATDTVLGRTVAVKLMHPALGQEQDFVDRFRTEARHTAALHHPNITTVYDYGEDGGTSYLVMELVAGQPLSRLISERAPLSAQETASILSQAASALEAAHQGEVVHRDVKPANILITPDGTVKLTDFGISRALDAAPLTQVGQVLGTAQYLSPEQAMGQVATASSDIYALGVVGHEMLTGRRPFEAGGPVATALAHVNQPPPPLPETVPTRIRDVVSACLAKDPADRPASAAAVAHALTVTDAALAAPWLVVPAPTQTIPAQTMPAQTMPARAMPTQTEPTRAMPIQAVTNEPPGIRGDRSGHRRAWLLGAAAATVLGILAVFALSDNGGGAGAGAGTGTVTPSPRATPSTSATPSTRATPSTSATVVVEPPAVAPPVPRRDNKGPGNKDDKHKKGN